MISNSSKYAIKAVLYLAVYSSEQNKIMVKDISKPINVPQAYLAKLLQELSRQHIISSTRGPKGGFYLSDRDKSQSLINIVNVIDGEQKMKSCMLSLKNCDENKPCPLHNLVGPSRAHLLKRLETTAIKNLSKGILEGNTILPL